MSNCGLIRESVSHAVVKSILIPYVPDDYILVKTVAIALNPTDWTTLDAKGANETLVGCDYAGIVEAVGSAVKKPLKKRRSSLRLRPWRYVKGRDERKP